MQQHIGRCLYSPITIQYPNTTSGSIAPASILSRRYMGLSLHSSCILRASGHTCTVRRSSQCLFDRRSCPSGRCSQTASSPNGSLNLSVLPFRHSASPTWCVCALLLSSCPFCRFHGFVVAYCLQQATGLQQGRFVASRETAHDENSLSFT
jgi:hypothetical protein